MANAGWLMETRLAQVAVLVHVAAHTDGVAMGTIFAAQACAFQELVREVRQVPQMEAVGLW